MKQITHIFFFLILGLGFFLNPNCAEAVYKCSPGEVPEGKVIERVEYASCGGLNYRYHYRNPRSSGIWVCDVSSVPSGYVVTEKIGPYETISSDDCAPNSSGYGYRKYIKEPRSSGQWICGSTVPPGFVITEKDYWGSHASDCNGLSSYIRAPTSSQMEICSSTAWVEVGDEDEEDPILVQFYPYIPAGYLVTRNDRTSSNCPSSSNSISGLYYRIQRTEDLVGSSTWICESQSPLPDGYVKSDIDTNGTSDCNGSAYRLDDPNQVPPCGYSTDIPTGYIAERIENPSVTPPCYIIKDLAELTTNIYFTYCPFGSSVPSGYIVTAVGSDSSRCGNTSTTYTIVKPALGQIYNYCQAGPIPAGFSIYADNPFANCGVFDGYTIGPLQSGSTICEDLSGYTVIPDNLQITQVIYDSNCPYNYKLRIEEATGQTMNVCGDRAMPANYVTTSIRPNDPNCAGRYGKTIAPVTGQNIWVCRSPIYPDGYVIKDTQLNTGECGILQRDLIGVVSLSDNQICETSPIPDGYVVVARTPNECGSGVARIEIALPSESGQTDICANSPVPSGYVVIRFEENGACGNSVGTDKVIQRPNSTGFTTVCDPIILPEGYTVYDIISFASQCNGPGYRIWPENETVVPASFINGETENYNTIGLDCGDNPDHPIFKNSSARVNNVNCN